MKSSKSHAPPLTRKFTRSSGNYPWNTILTRIKIQLLSKSTRKSPTLMIKLRIRKNAQNLNKKKNRNSISRAMGVKAISTMAISCSWTSSGTSTSRTNIKRSRHLRSFTNGGLRPFTKKILKKSNRLISLKWHLPTFTTSFRLRLLRFLAMGFLCIY